jgi:hypothetical protein
MNTKNLWIASLSGAAVSLLATNLPYIGLINCLLCAGFWGSAIFAVWLYRRLSGMLTIGDAIRVGALSGLLAGGIGLALSFVGLAGIQALTNSFVQTLPPDAIGDMDEIPAVVASGMNLMGVGIELVFGVIGGWIGGMVFRTNRPVEKIGE